jgi:hypothetical protein
VNTEIRQAVKGWKKVLGVVDLPADTFDPNDLYPGMKVCYAFPENGWPEARKRTSETFTLGEPLTVKAFEIGQSITYITFEEIAGAWNSVMFGAINDNE